MVEYGWSCHNAGDLATLCFVDFTGFRAVVSVCLWICLQVIVDVFIGGRGCLYRWLWIF